MAARSASNRLGAAMRRLRRERGLSQEALAECAGLDRTFIGLLERGKRRATLESTEAIAHALGMSLSELVTHLDNQFDAASSNNAG